MTSSFTTNKSLEKPGNGDYTDTWNVPVNGDMDVIDQAFGGVTSLNATGGSATLTSTQYRSLVLSISGAMSADVVYTIPSGVGGQWIVRNTTTDTSGGPWNVIIASAGGGTSVTVLRSQNTLVYSDGTNIRSANAEPTTTIPSGVILMWSGSIASIPSGWLICDGTSGTPDLRNRFVVGAGSTYSVNATGGSADAVVVSHTHTASVTDPGHVHTLLAPNRTTGFGGTNSGFQAVWEQTTTGTTDSATTGISVSNSSTGVSGTNANLPPYFALAYIMKA